MPGLNGTGPLGTGRMYGRGLGWCSGLVNPLYYNRGWGFGRGMRKGFGRGFGGIFPLSENYLQDEAVLNYNDETFDENNYLKNRKEFLLKNIEAIDKRLDAIKNK